MLGPQGAWIGGWATVLPHVTPLCCPVMAQAGSHPASPAAALGFAALTGVGMLVGVWAVRRFERWAIEHTGELIAFASGLLVSGALIHLISRSAELSGSGAFGWALASFLLLYIVEAHFIPHVHARGESIIEEPTHRRASIGPLVVAGLGVHSIVDGLAVGAGLSVGTVIGSITLVLVMVHKIPVGIASMSALYHSGVPGRRAVWISSGLAMITPLTVTLSYVVFRGVSDDVLGILLALAGGSFLYVGAADLLPEGQARGRPVNTLMFILGIAVMVALKIGVE